MAVPEMRTDGITFAHPHQAVSHNDLLVGFVFQRAESILFPPLDQ